MTLGTTDLEVQGLGLGTAELGQAYGIGRVRAPSREQAVALVHAALDLGIDYFDTAASYGASEELLGRALAGCSRRPVIATKLSLPRRPDGSPERGDALRKGVEASVLRSLARLRAERLDVLQLHNASPRDLALPELWEAFDALERRGLVRHLGATTYGADDARAGLAHVGRLRVLQVAYNLLDRSLEAEVLPRARASGMAVVLRSVFLKGVLSHRAAGLPPRLAELRHAAAQARALAEQAGLTLPALALRFAAHSPFAGVALVGTAHPDELRENVAAWRAGPLPAELQARLARLPRPDTKLCNPAHWMLEAS